MDERWLVPHFEKMSYDNSELLKNYVHGWQVTQNPFLKSTAEGIIGWVNGVLSDQALGGFYASQDADYSLDDDGDYFTWTLEELRAALPAEESRIMELYYDVEAHGEMHHNPAKNVLWMARDAGEIARTLGLDESAVSLTIAKAKKRCWPRDCHAPRRLSTDDVRELERHVCFGVFRCRTGIAGKNGWRSLREFALKTIERMLREAWTEEQGFAHRIGGPALRGSLDDQVFGVIALLDAYEATLDTKYFNAAQRPWTSPLRNMAMRKAEVPLIAPQTRRRWAGLRSEASHSGFTHAGSQFRRDHGINEGARLHGRPEIL